MNIILKGKENVYQQIINEYKRFITLDIIKKDDKLPSCRTLANELGINPNTVIKAYAVLEKEGYIKIIPKKGVYVIYERKQDAEILELKKQIIQFKESNIEYNQLIKIINEIYGRIKND